MNEPFHKRQPILAGCLGCVGVGILGTIAAVVFMTLLGKSCIDNASKQLGVDSLPATVRDAMAQGYGISIDSTPEGTKFSVTPMEPRAVTCADVHGVLFPHLTGTLETVVVHSESYEAGPDGTMQPVPITCTWSGFPTKETPAGDPQ